MGIENVAEEQLSLEQKVDLILKTVVKINTEVTELRNENKQLKEKIVKMEKTIDYLESQIIQNELFFYGITAEETEEEVLNVINNFIKLPCKVSPDQIQKVSKIGKGDKKDILVKFVSIKTRDAILKNAKNLRNTKYAVAPRRTKHVMEERQLLKPYLQDALTLGHDAKLINNTICINNKLYNLEQCKSMKLESADRRNEELHKEESTINIFQSSSRSTRSQSKTNQGSK